MHIPGPWKLVKIPAGNWSIEAKLQHPKGQAIAKIFEIPVLPRIKHADLKDGVVYIEIAYDAWYQFEIGDWNEKTWEANAKLMTAAPNLYQAALYALADLEGLRNQGICYCANGKSPQIETIKKLKEAIAMVENEITP